MSCGFKSISRWGIGNTRCFSCTLVLPLALSTGTRRSVRTRSNHRCPSAANSQRLSSQIPCRNPSLPSEAVKSIAEGAFSGKPKARRRIWLAAASAPGGGAVDFVIRFGKHQQNIRVPQVRKVVVVLRKGSGSRINVFVEVRKGLDGLACVVNVRSDVEFFSLVARLVAVVQVRRGVERAEAAAGNRRVFGGHVRDQAVALADAAAHELNFKHGFRPFSLLTLNTSAYVSHSAYPYLPATLSMISLDLSRALAYSFRVVYLREHSFGGLWRLPAPGQRPCTGRQAPSASSRSLMICAYTSSALARRHLCGIKRLGFR